MSGNQHLDYYELGDALAGAQTSADAAACHGLLAGLVCATGFTEPKIWVTQIFEEYDPKDRLQAEAFKQLQALCEQTQAQINSEDLDFELLLPDDEDALHDRTEALGSWCGSFLSGLGLAGLEQSQLSQEVTELLDDLTQIARVDFDLDAPDEEDLAAFEEVVEYVRIGVLFINEELQPVGKLQAPTRLQ
jgi:yecA family protein